MAEPVSTVRALEIILSRVRMDNRTASILACALSQERSHPSPQPTTDPDTHRASLQVILNHLSDVHLGFSKQDMHIRICDAAREIRQLLGS